MHAFSKVYYIIVYFELWFPYNFNNNVSIVNNRYVCNEFALYTILYW